MYKKILNVRNDVERRIKNSSFSTFRRFFTTTEKEKRLVRLSGDAAMRRPRLHKTSTGSGKTI